MTTASTASEQSQARPGADRPVPGWHRLRVTRTAPAGHRATAIWLDVPEPLRGAFAHRPGQHVVVRSQVRGRELRRSYSLCPPPEGGPGLRLVVKYLGPGGFAEYATTTLAAGDHLELSPPRGHFTLTGQPGAHHVLIGGGSGVTPLLGIAGAALREDPRCRVSLVYANRTAQSVLLADELSDLKDAHVQRFHMLHVLTQEAGESELLTGRIEGDRLPALLSLLAAEPDGRTQFYLCGPAGLVDGARQTLARWGAGPERVRFELFSTGAATSRPQPSTGPAPTGLISARLGGRTTTVPLGPQDRVVLDALLRAGRRPRTPAATACAAAAGPR
ncbi:hypothetical protein GXW82_12480 [Streptacidiphilus sp. 4-A2]|nr:hypothetical protein [Streptacidiphilus sp. 4-A2]